MSEVSPSVLRELIEYNPMTGALFWRARDLRWFSCPRLHRSWNTQWAGTQAFCTPTEKGYLRGNVFRQNLKAHRVAFAVYYSRWPDVAIDHVNGNRADNRIANLREVTVSENNRNRFMPATNASGRVGVRKRDGSWVAFISDQGKKRHIGAFKCFEDAVAARQLAEQQLGYHQQHGRPRL